MLHNGGERALIRNNEQGDWTVPDAWVFARVERIAEIQSGVGFPKDLQGQKSGDYPLAKVSDISNAVLEDGGVLSTAANYVTVAIAEKLKAKVYPLGSTLFAKIGEAIGLNRRAIAAIPVLADNNVMGLLPDTGKVLPRYLFYFMHIVDLYEYSQATTVPSIRKSDVARIEVPLAPLPEQRRIVAEIETQFTRLDAAVAALQRAQAALQRYKASVLKAACEGRLLPEETVRAIRTGPGRPVQGESPDYEPADQLLARILAERRTKWEEQQWQKEIERAKKKAAQAARRAAGLPSRIRDLTEDEWQDLTEDVYGKYLPKNDRWKQNYSEPRPPDIQDLPRLPEGWTWADLEQLSWQSGYGTSQKCTYDALGPPVLRIPNIVGGTIELDDLKFATDPERLNRADEVAPGDLLIIRTNGSRALIGRSALVRKSFSEPHLFASYLIRYRLLRMFYWIAAIWDAPFMRTWLERGAATTAGQYNLSVRTLDRLPVPLAPLTEQRRIVEEVERRLSVVLALEAAVQANLRRAERLRQSILKRAFEGRLVPQDPNDEPASALLERIRAQREAHRPQHRTNRKTERGQQNQGTKAPQQLELL